jgi:hypothetical protein
VHEDDPPGACLFLQEGRFQPVLVHGARGVGDAAFIDVGDPRDVAANVDVGVGHVLVVALAGRVLGFDGTHDGVAVESRAIREDVEVRCYDGVELRDVLCACCTEYRTRCFYDLCLVGSDRFMLGARATGFAEDVSATAAVARARRSLDGMEETPLGYWINTLGFYLCLDATVRESS